MYQRPQRGSPREAGGLAGQFARAAVVHPSEGVPHEAPQWECFADGSIGTRPRGDAA